jgi:hypothetical protein
VTILKIKTDAILDSDVRGLRHPSDLSIHPTRKTSKRLSLSKKVNVRADRAISLSKKATSAIYQDESLVIDVIKTGIMPRLDWIAGGAKNVIIR